MYKRRLFSLIMSVIILLTSTNDKISANEYLDFFQNNNYSIVEEEFENIIDLEFLFDEHPEFSNKQRAIDPFNDVELNVTLTTKYTFGEARNVKIHLDLPYLEYDEDGKTYQYSSIASEEDPINTTEGESEDVGSSEVQISSGGSLQVSTPGAIEPWEVATPAAIVPELTKENGVGITLFDCDDAWILPDLPDDGIAKGNIEISRMSLAAGSSPSFKLRLNFYGDVLENAVADIKGYISYEMFNDDTVNWETPNRYTEDAEVRIVKTGLVWSTKVTTLQKDTTVWDRFNYVPFDYTIENTSEKLQIDRFSVNMAIPYQGEYYKDIGYIGGMTDLDAYLWTNTDTGPAYNGSLEKTDGNKYVGVEEKGGVLIYDITGQEDLPLEEKPSSKPLEYTYTGAALLTLRQNDGSEILYSKNDSRADPTKVSKRTYRIFVPFDNRFMKDKLPFEFNMKIQPTIYVGDKDRFILWTKEANDKFKLHAPDMKLMTFNKVVQDAPTFFGVEGAYYLQNIHNPSNAPYFSPYIVDTIPKDFDITKITYEIDWNHVDPPDLQDYLSTESPMLEYEITYRNRWGGTVTEPYSSYKKDAIGKQVGGKYIWEFDIAGDLKDRFNMLSESGISYPELNRDITIHLKDRIDSKETLAGKIGIYGTFQIGGPVTNTAFLYYDFKCHIAPERYYPGGKPAYLPDYRITAQGPIYAEATANVIKPNPIISVKGVNGELDEIGDNIPVPYDGVSGGSFYSGFRYYLGNTTDSPMEPGTFYCSIPVFDAKSLNLSQDRYGLIAQKILISKEMWKERDRIMSSEQIELIDKIVLVRKNPDSTTMEHVIDGSTLNALAHRDGTGEVAEDLILEKGTEHWPASLEAPDEVYVFFNQFNEDKNPIANDNYIEILGRTTLYEKLESRAMWSVNLNGEILADASDLNAIDVIKPKPIIRVMGYDGELKEVYNDPIVQYNGLNASPYNSGFRYYLGNTTGSPMIPGSLYCNLPVYEPTAAIGDTVRNGLMAEQIVFSKELWNKRDEMMLTDGIEMIHKIVLIRKNPDSTTIEHVVSGSALNALAVRDANGSVDTDLIISKGTALWPDSVEAPDEVYVYFNRFPRNIIQPEVDNIYVEVLGRTTRYGELKSNAIWSCINENGMSLGSNGLNTINVIKPKPQVAVKAVNKLSQVGDNLVVDYDGFYGTSSNTGFHYYMGNSTSSAMENVQMSIQLPVYEPDGKLTQRNGLLPQKILLSKELMELERTYRAGGSYCIEEISLIEERANEAARVHVILGSDLLINPDYDSNGNLLIKQGGALWPSSSNVQNPNKIIVKMNEFPGEIDPLTDGIYIGVYGQTTRFGDLITSADWVCKTVHFGSFSAAGSNKLYVTIPAPKVLAYANYAQFTNQVTTASTNLSDGSMGWTKLPYGRKGEYYFRISNDSTSAVPESTIKLEFGDYGSFEKKEQERGYRLKEFKLPKAILAVMDLDYIEIVDTSNQVEVIKKFSEGYYLADGPVNKKGNRLDLTDDIMFTKNDISWMSNIESITLFIKHFDANIKADNKYTITTKGYLDNLPFQTYYYQYLGSYYLAEPPYPSNISDANWETTINERQKLASRDIAGFRTIAAFIDYNMYAKIGATSYTNATTLYNEYEYATYGLNQENQDMDIGYKSMGSFVSGIKQDLRYDANVKMSLKVEFDLPENDFNLYYIKLHKDLIPYLDKDEAVAIYRKNTPEPIVVSGGALQLNAKDLSGNANAWYRINTLLPDNHLTGNLFTTEKVDTKNDMQVHPYYQSPRQDIILDKQVTKVVFKLHINQDDINADGKAKNPDLNIADNLFHFTGRFYKQKGQSYATSKITYDFGEEESLRANMEPNITLVGNVKTVKDMLNTYATNHLYWGNLNHWGTSDTKAFFNIHEPVAEVRKGVQNTPNKIPGSVTPNISSATTFASGSEPLFGDETEFLLGFWNGTDTETTYLPNSFNEWYGKKTFADEVKIIDTLPDVMVPEGAEDNPYEGFLVDTIKYTKKDLTDYSFRDHFVSLEIITDRGNRRTFTHSDFVGKEIQVNILYPHKGSLAGTSGIDFQMNANEFPKSYILTVKKLNGDGDVASEFSGVTLESQYLDNYNASIEVEGQICSIQYQNNQAHTQVNYKTGTENASSKSVYDYAKIKAVAPELSGQLKISNNISGENIFVYNPRQENVPNVMEYYYHISNPKKTGTAPKAAIGEFDIIIPSLVNYQLQYIRIPKNIFKGTIWSCSSFLIDNEEVSGNFVLSGEEYVLDLKQILSRYRIDPNGYQVYSGENAPIKAVFSVNDLSDKTLYLQEEQSLSTGPAITLQGMYAKKQAADADYSNSAVSLAHSPWNFNHVFSAGNTTSYLNAYSMTKYSNPAKLQSSNNSNEHEVKNLVANVDFSLSAGAAYDQHENTLNIKNTELAPGDRFKVKLTMKNQGDPNNFVDGFTGLELPMMRYTIPKGVRIVEWNCITSDTTINSNHIVCKDLTDPSSPSTIVENTEYDTTSSYVKDLVFVSDQKLEEGGKIVLELTLEYTDETKLSLLYPNVYQGAYIPGVNGKLTVSGGLTHGYYPFLYGARSNQYVSLPYGYQRGIVTIDPTDATKTSLNGAYRTDNESSSMITVGSLSLKVEAKDKYNGMEENITESEAYVTVGNIKNTTKHESTKVEVEVILDHGTHNLKGMELLQWPTIEYPKGFVGEYSEPILYYKNVDESKPWEIATGSSISADLYAIKWDYGTIPAYDKSGNDFKLEDVKLHVRAHWRSATPINDINPYYEVKTTAKIHLTHESHGYLQLGDATIGNITNYNYKVYKKVPFAELDIQVFDKKSDAMASYIPSNSKRKQSYRPDENFWYKITLKNKSRDQNYSEVGTGALIDPVIFDKVPEYLTTAMIATGGALDLSNAEASGNFKIVWYDKDNNPKSFTPPKVTVTEIEDYDIGGSQRIYLGVNAKISAAEMTASTARKIKFYVYEYQFEEELDRDERIEIQYRVKSRTDNLPLLYYKLNGDQYTNYLPRVGEYAANRYPQLNVTDHITGKSIADSVMDGDFLIHEVGVSGTPNENTPKNDFLNHSLAWIPGYDSSVYHLAMSELSGHNGYLDDYDMKTAFIQQVEMKYSGDNIQYINARYQPSYYSQYSRDIWELILKPRVKNFGSSINYDGNILWSQNRIHLSKAWLYAGSQILPEDKAMKHEVDMETYYQNEYVYGLERGDTFTSRLHVKNYGDYHLDGVEVVYVLPRGTEPIFKENGAPNFIAYYGDPDGTAQKISDVDWEILQSPTSLPADPIFAPKELMTAKDGRIGTFYTASEKNSYPWVIRITVNEPLTAWWNQNNSLKVTDNGAASYGMYINLKAKVIEENVNKNWYDEVFVTSKQTEAINYMQVYNKQYSEHFNYNPSIRGIANHSGRLLESETGISLTSTDRFTIDTDFDGIADEKMYAHNGDKALLRTPMIRLWTDIGNANTSDFYHETKDKPFDINIHAYNRYEWAENPKPRSNAWEAESALEKYHHNHQTDGGMKGTYFEPILVNILPYGVVPVDTDGIPLPALGTGWKDDGSRAIDYSVSGLPLFSKKDWNVKTEFLEEDEYGNKINRYKLTFTPLDYSNLDEEVKIAYNEHLIITFKASVELWPENTYLPFSGGLLLQDRNLNSRWQENRIYASSKKEIFYPMLEPATSPYIVGKERRLNVSQDLRPDIQGAYDKIKAKTLGSIKLLTEEAAINLEDYSHRTSLILTKEQKDFNNNQAAATNPADDMPGTTDKYVTNTMKIFTKHPRIVVDKQVARKEKTLTNESPLTLSYGNEFWYNIDVANEPVPITNGASLDNLMLHEATKGSLLSSDIKINEWMPEHVTYEDYLIQYSGSVSGSYETLDSNELISKGWEVNTRTVSTEPGFLAFSIKTSPNFNSSSTRPKREGDLRSGETFRLKLKTRVTSVGIWDNKPLTPWGAYENRVYVEAESFDTSAKRQPDNFNDYVTLIKESAKNADYNQDGDREDELATSNAFIKIKKPKGLIRQDTYQKRVVFESDGIDNPMFSSGKAVTFMIDELHSDIADMPELFIQLNGLSKERYEKKTVAPDCYELDVHEIKTGKWSVPSGYDPNDYKIYVYYTLKDSEFDEFVDASDLLPLDITGIGLTEDKVLKTIPNSRDIHKVILVIRSDHPDTNPVPGGIRVDVDANNNLPGKQEVSEVDPGKRNVDGYTDSVYKNSPQISYLPIVTGGESYILYSNVSLWGRYSKNDVLMLGKDTAGITLTPSNPVLDITNKIQYLKYDAGRKQFKWDNNIAVQPTNSRYVKYTIDFTNIEDARAALVFYQEDKLINPVIVDALPSIVTVDKNNFRMAEKPEEIEVFDDDFTTPKNLNDNIPKWTWEIIKGSYRSDETPESKLTFDSTTGVEVTPINRPSAYRPNELFTRNVVRWKFNGYLEPGDTLRVQFIGTVDGYEVDETKSTVNDAYGFSASGTFIVYLDPSLKDYERGAGLDVDDYDLNNNNKVDDRLIRNESRGIGFVTASDLKKVKKVYTDLDRTGGSTKYIAPVEEGSKYTFKTSIVNTNENYHYYQSPIIYDMLPYAGDKNIVGNLKNGVYESPSRKSNWSGWLLPETIQLEETGEGSAGVISKDQYEVWVGPFVKDGSGYKVLNPEDLPDINTRSQLSFYQEITGMGTQNKETYLRSQNFIKLSELLAVKTADPEAYDSLRKGAAAIYIQTGTSSDYKLYGQNNLVLSYDMEAPQNLPVLIGNQSDDNHIPYSSFNSFAAWTKAHSRASESNAAGVYINAPEGKAWIGNYIWEDENGNGILDEVETEIGSNGRILSKITDPNKDPGINEVKIELLSKDGLPVDKYGNALVQKEGSTDYYIAGPDGKTPLTDIFERELRGGDPVVSYTTSDYAGRKGYYVLTNIEPGEYRLKYTFPKEYKYYGISTLQTHDDLTLQGQEPTSDSDDFVILTDSFQLVAGQNDSDYMDFDIGVQMPVRYGGTAWIDEHISELEKGKNGKMDFPTEKTIEEAVIQLYTADGTMAIDMLGKNASTITNADGSFLFHYLKPDENYYAVVKYSDQENGYPTPIVSSSPLDSSEDNDLFRTSDGVNKTELFTASIPTEHGAAKYADNYENRYSAVEKLGFGFISLEESMIAGTVYEDKNRNGFMDEQEAPYKEHEIYLTRYIYWSDKWELDDSFPEVTGKTSEEGNYYFDQLENLSPEGKPYGYQVTIKNFPAGYTPTYYHMASTDWVEEIRSKKDSDLNESGILYHRDKTEDITGMQLIVFAEEWNQAWVPNSEVLSGLNAGFTLNDRGDIEGTISSRLNGTTIIDQTAALEVSLEARLKGTLDYYPVILSGQGNTPLVHGMAGYDISGKKYQVQTDHNGRYEFEELPLAEETSRVLYEYQVVVTKPLFAEWIPDVNYEVASGGAITLYKDIELTEQLPQSKFGFNFLEAKNSTANDMYLRYPAPSIVKGIYYHDIDQDGIADNSEVLTGRKVLLYTLDPESNTWIPYNDLNGNHETITDSDGTYSFMVNSAEYDLRSSHLMEQKKYKLVFEKMAKESYLPNCDVKIASESGLSDTEKQELSLDWLKHGVTEDISFGSISYEDAQYGGRDVVDIYTVEAVKNYNCSVIEANDASIKGTVWNDENGNGIMDSAESAAANRNVYLYQWTGTKWENVPDLNGNSLLKTKDDGTYEFIVDAAEYQSDSSLLDLNRYRILFEKDIKEYYSDPEQDNSTSNIYSLMELEDHPGFEKDLMGEYCYGMGKEEITLANLIYSDEAGKDIADRSSIYNVSGIDCGIVPHRTNTISGIVWNDNNQNGLFDSSEHTAAGKKVAIYRLNRDNGIWEPYTDYNDNQFEKFTNAYGKYEFEVDAVHYDIHSDHALFVNEFRVVFEKEESGEYFTKAYMKGDQIRGSSARTEEELTEPVPGIILDSTKAVTDSLRVVSGGALSVTTGGAITVSSEPATTADWREFENRTNINCGIMEQPYGVIKGLVWKDENADGIRQTQEIVLSGEELSLYQYDEISGSWKAQHDINGVHTYTTEENGTYEFLVNVADYEKANSTYLEQNRFRVLAKTNYGEGFTITYEGVDSQVDSDGMTMDQFTDYELESLREIILTDLSAVTDEIIFGTLIFDPTLDKDIVDFDSIINREAVDFGVVKTEEGSIVIDRDNHVTDIEIPELPIPGSEWITLPKYIDLFREIYPDRENELERPFLFTNLFSNNNNRGRETTVDELLRSQTEELLQEQQSNPVDLDTGILLEESFELVKELEGENEIAPITEEKETETSLQASTQTDQTVIQSAVEEVTENQRRKDLIQVAMVAAVSILSIGGGATMYSVYRRRRKVK